LNRIVYAIVPTLGLLCQSCAAVDQFSTRTVDGNSNAQTANNQEVLLNIVRASQFQSLVWTPVNQYSGTQTETLSTILPTVFFGPNQPPADQIHSLSNTLSSGVTGNYQANPILTSAFQEGMLTPVDLRTIAKLSTLYPREIVLFALIQSITITNKNLRGGTTTLINDPEQNFIQKPAETINPNDLSNIRNDQCDAVVRSNTPLQNISDGYNCTYAKFKRLLDILLTIGLNVELITQADGSAKSTSPPAGAAGQTGQGSNTNTSTSSTVVGRFCISPGKSASSFQGTAAAALSSWLCTGAGETPKGSNTAVTTVTETKTEKTANGGVKVTTKQSTTPSAPNTGKNGCLNYDGVSGDTCVVVDLRSPAQYISYLGLWLKYHGVVETPDYATLPAQRVIGDQNYLVLTSTLGDSCYTSVTYQGLGYCVPQSATHTAMLMDIGTSLRNLNISPSDLNAPVTVRVTQ
jgi:hypothetical protein